MLESHIDPSTMVLIVFLAAVLLGVFIAVLVFIRTHPVEPILEPDREVTEQFHPSEPEEQEKPEALPQWREEPLPVVPERPPTISVYTPREGRPVLPCSCHQEPLAKGRPVMFWPIPEPKGAVLLFCEKTMTEMKKGIESSGHNA